MEAQGDREDLAAGCCSPESVPAQSTEEERQRKRLFVQKRVKLWDVATNTSVFATHIASCCLASSDTEKSLVYAIADSVGSIRVYNDTLSLMGVMTPPATHTGTLKHLVFPFSHQSPLLLSVSEDGQLIGWDVTLAQDPNPRSRKNTGKLSAASPSTVQQAPPTEPVPRPSPLLWKVTIASPSTAFCVSRSGSLIAAASHSSVQFWKLGADTTVAPHCLCTHNLTDNISSLCFTPTGDALVCILCNGTICTLSLQAGESDSYSLHAQARVDLSGDNICAALSCNNAQLCIWQKGSADTFFLVQKEGVFTHVARIEHFSAEEGVLLDVIPDPESEKLMAVLEKSGDVSLCLLETAEASTTRDITTPINKPVEIKKKKKKRKHLKVASIHVCKDMSAILVGTNEDGVVTQWTSDQNLVQRHLEPVDCAQFPEYLSEEELQQGLKDHRLLRGVFQCMNWRPEAGVVVVEDSPWTNGDIKITSYLNRNRALQGDVVAVQVIAEKERKTEGKDIQVLPDLLLEEEASTEISEEEEGGENAGTPRRRLPGRIVGILERKHATKLVGTLRFVAEREGGASKEEYALFTSTNPKIVPTLVPKAECTAVFQRDIVQQGRQLRSEREYFVEVLLEPEWRKDMKYPLGRVERVVGPRGQIATETEALLLEKSLRLQDFPEEIVVSSLRQILQLPPELHLTTETRGESHTDISLLSVLPKGELERRVDIRQSHCTFTIDPETARDFDDALSCRVIASPTPLTSLAACLERDDVTYEVGVHIADVSYYVRPGSALDNEAKDRATSTYLVHRAIHMLPEILSCNFCSLQPDKDRLTFSVFFTLDSQGNVVDQPRFARTVIRSASRMTYAQAQQIISEEERIKALLSAEPKSSSIVEEGLVDFNVGANVVQGVLVLNRLAKNIRERRWKDTLAVPGAKKNLVWQFKEPSILRSSQDMEFSCEGVESGAEDSHNLIEEYMLLANRYVAEKIYRSFPQLAALRFHPPPAEKKHHKLLSFLNQLPEEALYSDSLDVAEDPDDVRPRIKSLLESPFARRNLLLQATVQKMALECMEMALYFCAGEGVEDELEGSHQSTSKWWQSFSSDEEENADGEGGGEEEKIHIAADDLVAWEETKRLELNLLMEGNESRTRRGSQKGKEKVKSRSSTKRERKRAGSGKSEDAANLSGKKKIEIGHYGLDIPFYTHFTSPIRRYIDIVVHRLLAAAIMRDQKGEGIESDTSDGGDSLPNKEDIVQICDNCNKKSSLANNVSSAFTDLFLWIYFCRQPERVEGIVTFISSARVGFFIPKFGLSCNFTQKQIRNHLGFHAVLWRPKERRLLLHKKEKLKPVIEEGIPKKGEKEEEYDEETLVVMKGEMDSGALQAMQEKLLKRLLELDSRVLSLEQRRRTGNKKRRRNSAAARKKKREREQTTVVVEEKVLGMLCTAVIEVRGNRKSLSRKLNFKLIRLDAEEQHRVEEEASANNGTEGQ